MKTKLDQLIYYLNGECPHFLYGSDETWKPLTRDDTDELLFTIICDPVWYGAPLLRRLIESGRHDDYRQDRNNRVIKLKCIRAEILDPTIESSIDRLTKLNHFVLCALNKSASEDIIAMYYNEMSKFFTQRNTEIEQILDVHNGLKAFVKHRGLSISQARDAPVTEDEDDTPWNRYADEVGNLAKALNDCDDTLIQYLVLTTDLPGLFLTMDEDEAETFLGPTLTRFERSLILRLIPGLTQHDVEHGITDAYRQKVLDDWRGKLCFHSQSEETLNHGWTSHPLNKLVTYSKGNVIDTFIDDALKKYQSEQQSESQSNDSSDSEESSDDDHDSTVLEPEKSDPHVDDNNDDTLVVDDHPQPLDPEADADNKSSSSSDYGTGRVADRKRREKEYSRSKRSKSTKPVSTEAQASAETANPDVLIDQEGYQFAITYGADDYFLPLLTHKLTLVVQREAQLRWNNKPLPVHQSVFRNGNDDPQTLRMEDILDIDDTIAICESERSFRYLATVNHGKRQINFNLVEFYRWNRRS